MKCKDMTERLISLIYGELSPDEAKKTESHIKSCDSCRKIYKELKETTEILDKWKEITLPTNFVFTTEAPGFNLWNKSIRSMGRVRKFMLGISIAAAFCLLLLSIINFEAKYEYGKWSIGFHLIPQAKESITKEYVEQLVKESQKQILIFTSRMIEESERRTDIDLTRLVQTIEEQRQKDLQFITKGLIGLKQTNDWRFDQTEKVIDRLYRLTSYQFNKK